ncbi:MAG: ABC transporter ATP-binding protein [Kosmotoga sp.]|nr:MAG: ABC transporter ATP-binding protein [Kosmotoga sp.]
MNKLIKITNLSYSYTELEVLKKISLSINRGEVLGILGPNGSGKTTLLKIISGILKDYKGFVKIKGKEVRSFSPKELAKIVSFVPQEFNPTFNLKSETIISFGRNPYINFFGGFTKKDFEIIDHAMNEADVLSLKDRDFFTLSGGEKQRVVIAKTFAQRGQILLLDELTTHLDPGHTQKITDIIMGKIKKENLTTIMVAHDVNEAISFSHRLIFVKEGKIIAEGKPEDIISEELIRTVYGAKSLIIENPLTRKPYVIYH